MICKRPRLSSIRSTVTRGIKPLCTVAKITALLSPILNMFTLATAVQVVCPQRFLVQGLRGVVFQSGAASMDVRYMPVMKRGVLGTKMLIIEQERDHVGKLARFGGNRVDRLLWNVGIHHIDSHWLLELPRCLSVMNATSRYGKIHQSNFAGDVLPRVS